VRKGFEHLLISAHERWHAHLGLKGLATGTSSA
jgi:hypothetical protein